ncbi:MAG: hypothetical protein R3A44_27290 [Caldilineaceae bacterium]
MSAAQSIAFVLWGDHFDEAAAALFITGLRKAGQRVKVVGINGPQGRGACGLSLVADMTLSEALPLAKQAACIIIPCNDAALRRMGEEPQVMEFMEQVGVGIAPVVVMEGVSPYARLFQLTGNRAVITASPAAERITLFVGELLAQL